jgi:uncharacterized protein (TIGR03083 family)
MTISIGVAEMKRQNVLDIPKLAHTEAKGLSQTEYERVVSLLETLTGDDWQQATYCREWNVQEMVAHLAGAVTGSSSFAEFRHQNIQNPYLREFDEPIDGINKLQLVERADRTPAELIAEFRQNGQKAVDNRQNLPWLVRKVIHLPMKPLGFASLEYLMDTIYPRDQWMHRYDICAATGKKMVVTGGHDGRLVALVVRDVAKKLRKILGSRTIVLQLTGVLAAEYQFGDKAMPDCTVAIDFFDFNLRASGRISVAEAMGRMAVSGDEDTATWFLQNLEVPY